MTMQHFFELLFRFRLVGVMFYIICYVFNGIVMVCSVLIPTLVDEWFSKYLSSLFLNVFVVFAVTTASGRCSQQAHHVESTCNWSEKLVDTCFTKNPGVFHVDLFMCIIGVDLHGDIKFEPNFFSRVLIHVAFLMWIIGVHFQVYSTWIVSRGWMVYPFTWISDEYHVKNATLLCFTCFPRVFFTGIISISSEV